MKNSIIIAGGSGFLGQILARHFAAAGQPPVILTRGPDGEVDGVRHVHWDGQSGGAWERALEDAAALINLAGRSVNCRYHARNRREILNSRVQSTRLLGDAIRRCPNPPPVWLNSSTATIYRHTFGPAWDESGEIAGTPEAKDEFSVEVAQAWEEELARAETPRTSKVALRLAMVLGRGPNSVFPVLERLVRFGLGGRMGDGRQFVSWIHERDFCRAVEWLIEHEAFEGPVNVCAPFPLPNAEMMQTLRSVYRIPVGLPASRWMLEIGAFLLRTETELILKSRRVVPARLLESRFKFEFPELREAARDLRTRR